MSPPAPCVPQIAELPEVRGHARALLARGLTVAAKERKAGADAEGKYRVYHAFDAPFHAVRPHQAPAADTAAAPRPR